MQLSYEDPEVVQLVILSPELFKPFNFITANSRDQILSKEDLSLQWPLQWPAKHWETESSNIIIFKGLNTKTINTAYLESHWLNRTIQSSNKDKVYFTFTMNIFDLQHFECEIIVLNHLRETITSFGRFDKDYFQKEENLVSLKRSILVNRHLAVDGIYKLVFKIRYSDQSDTKLFEIKDISYGDPCEFISCHEFDQTQLKPVPNRNNNCRRQTDPVDYSCECSPGLTGKDCSKVDYCTLKHLEVSIDLK